MIQTLEKYVRRNWILIRELLSSSFLNYEVDMSYYTTVQVNTPQDNNINGYINKFLANKEKKR